MLKQLPTCGKGRVLFRLNAVPSTTAIDIVEISDAETREYSRYYYIPRSFSTYGALKDDNARERNDLDDHVHQKYNKPNTCKFEFKTYCAMTSLHGFHHFVENNFNKTEKLFWAIGLVAMYALCAVAIYAVILFFLEMPAIISLDNSVSSIWTIPFPAITLCSANGIRPSVYDYLNANNTDNDNQLVRNVMHSICERNPRKKKMKLSEEFLDGRFVSQILKNLSFPCEETVKEFSWLLQTESNPCDRWFQQTFTSYGLCYSFNMMPMGDLLNGVDEWSQETDLGWKNYRSSWQPDAGYGDNSAINRSPLRTFGDNDFYSATMNLDLHTDDFNWECAQGLDVFYILVHSPADWPDRTHPTLLISSNTLETISVRPTVLTTSDDLITWSPDIRRCYFQNEKRLTFFKVYTQKNCIMECRSVNILAQCGCVPFNYIRSKNTAVCGPAKMSCWVEASMAETHSCGCLPSCSEFHFELSAMNARFNRSTQHADSSLSIYSSIVLLRVFYQNKNYIGLNRILTFTFGQFMGNVGGIMGLCLGFSFLSLSEIVYFLTLRPLVNFYNSKKKMKRVYPIGHLMKPQI